MARRILFLATLLSVLSGCADDAPDGCTKDTDCKGDRICQMGTCVDPAGNDAGGDAGASDATATDAAADAAVDAGPADAASDAGPEDIGLDASDSGVDGGPDAEADAGLDAGVDSGLDAGADSGFADASADAGFDASDDSGVDAGPLDTGFVDGGDYAYYLDQTAFYDEPFYGSGPLFNQIDASFTYALPFAFTYFGTTYPAGSNLTITSNGTVWFDTPSTDRNNTLLPRAAAPHGVVAPFWDFLRFGGGVFASSTSDVVRIYFSNAADAATTNSNASFELLLYRNTNVIEFRYYSDPSGNYTATIGLEAPDGSRAIQLPCSPNCAIGAGSIVTFVPNGATLFGYDHTISSSKLPLIAYPNEEHTVTGVVANQGNQNSGGAIVRVLRTTASYFSLYNTVTEPTNDATPAIPIGQSRSTSPMTFNLGATPGTYRFAVWVDDPDEALLQNNSFDLGTVTILPYIDTINITSTMLPTGAVGQAYSFQLQATGSPNPTWTTPTTLPMGLSLGSQGLLSGTPSQSGLLQVEIRADEYGYAPDTTTLLLNIE